MRCHIALLVALLGWFASPNSAQIYAAQADPSAPSGYTVTMSEPPSGSEIDIGRWLRWMDSEALQDA